MKNNENANISEDSVIKSIFDGFFRFLPHLTYMMSIVFIVLLVFDKINAVMVFINNNLTKNCLIVYVILVAIQSIETIVRRRKAYLKRRETDGHNGEN